MSMRRRYFYQLMHSILGVWLTEIDRGLSHQVTRDSQEKDPRRRGKSGLPSTFAFNAFDRYEGAIVIRRSL